MALVIDTQEIQEDLYVANLKVCVPKKSINIDAKDLINFDVAEAWKTNGARVSFSLNVSKKINEFIDRYTVARREIVGHLMFDGHQFMMFEGQTNEFLEKCKELDDNFVADLEAILESWHEIKDDFESMLFEKMTIAVKKSMEGSHNRNGKTDAEIEEMINKSIEYYIRKFPTEDEVRDKCAVVVSNPKLFKQKPPKGLSKEAAEAYEKAEKQNIKLIYNLLSNEYLEIELDSCVGFVDEFVELYDNDELPHIFRKDIVDALKVTDEDDSEFDLENKGDSEKISIKDLKNSKGKSKYNVYTYRNLLNRCRSLIQNINNSIPMLAKVVSENELEQLQDMGTNLKLFSNWCVEWLKQYKASPKASPKASKSSANLVIVDEPEEIAVSEPVEKEVVVEEGKDENIEIVPDMISDVKTENTETVVSVDDDDFDIAI